MNRILKKAVSFISAVAVSVWALTSGMVTAYAAADYAGADVTATQAVDNKYDAYIAFEGGVLFAANSTKETTDSDGNPTTVFDINSKSKFVMVTDSGKKVSVKNTIGFDKIYAKSTSYDHVVPAVVESTQTNSYRDFLMVGKGDKYAVLLSDGSFLEKGKYFDSINSCNGIITAVSGKTSYFYDNSGTLIGKYNSTKVGNCVAYDKATKTIVTSFDNKGEVEHEKAYTHYIIKNNKPVKSFKNGCSSAEFTKIGKTQYIVFSNIFGKQYYTMKGKKANVAAEETNLKVSFDYSNDYSSCTVTVTDKKNNKIVSYNTPIQDFGKSNCPNHVFADGKLFLAFGQFYVIDDATGKILGKNTSKTFVEINSINSDSKTVVLSVGEKVKGEYGEYYKTTEAVYSYKSKCLSSNYDIVSPTDIVGAYDNTSCYIYSNDSAFNICNNYKWGILNKNCKVVTKPSYDYVCASDKRVSVMKKSASSSYAVLSNTTGKKLKTVYLDLKKQLWFPVIHQTSSNTSFIVTTNAAGNKFGCLVLKG